MQWCPKIDKYLVCPTLRPCEGNLVQFNVGADAIAYLTVSTQVVFRHWRLNTRNEVGKQRGKVIKVSSFTISSHINAKVWI